MSPIPPFFAKPPSYPAPPPPRKSSSSAPLGLTLEEFLQTKPPPPPVQAHLTPLSSTARCEHLESAQLLIKAGAETHPINANGHTSLDQAIDLRQDQIPLFLMDPTHFTTKPLPDRSGDHLEAFYYQAFETAYTDSERAKQLFYLEKLGALLLQQRDYLKASQLISSALAASISYEFELAYQKRLIKKLEKIETKFMHEGLGLKLEFAPLALTANGEAGFVQEHREQLAFIRKKAESLMNQRKPIEVVQADLSEGLCALLINIIQESIKILGKPPTTFAVLSLGSMSRKELCPYSDVEFAFLIKNSSHKEYFRKLSRLLELKVTNIGETRFELIRPRRSGEVMLPAKSFCSSGFSMDIGGLSPLGKKGVYELIGTPQELCSYQSDEWLTLNDAEIILANATASAALLTGDQTLFNDYAQGVKKALSQKLGTSRPLSGKGIVCREKRALALLKGHVEEFGPELSREKLSLRAFNVKKEFYRPFQMILESLSLYFEIKSRKTLERLEELQERKLISVEGAKNLKRAFNIASSLRFRTQFFYKEEIETMVYIESEKDKQYFPIGEEESEQIIEIYRTLFPFHKAAVAFLQGEKKSFRVNSFYDDKIGQGGEEAKEELHYREAQVKFLETAALNPSPFNLHELGTINLTVGNTTEALEHYSQALTNLKRTVGAQPSEEVAACLNQIGCVYRELGRFKEALQYHNSSLEMYQDLLNNKPHPLISVSLGNLGADYLMLGELDGAKYHLELAVIMQDLLFDEEPRPDTAVFSNNLGEVYASLGNTEKALEQHQNALAMRKLLYKNKPHPDISASLNNLGEIYATLGKTKKAIKCHEESLKIGKLLFGDTPHPDVAGSLNNLGTAYSTLGDTKKALNYHEQSLAMKRVLFGEEPHPHVAVSLNNLGKIYSTLGEKRKAIRYFEEAIKMSKLIFDDKPHPYIAIPLEDLGNAYKDLGMSAKANYYFGEAKRYTPQ